MKNNRSDGILPLAGKLFLSVSQHVWMFFMLMIVEAFLRVVPASLRYWIESAEEHRETNRLIRSHILKQQQADFGH